jgi:formylglycine-generating enzyme required for sulfatase activity
MAGNVAEWVADYASTDYYDLSPASNPTGPAEGTYRVIRGGSWNEFPTSIFTTSSSSNNPKNYDIVFGFRCVQDIKP